MKFKVITATIILWTMLTIICGYAYVVIGATWLPVAAEYETRWDYRMAFFMLSYFPVLLLVFLVILLIEWKYLPKK